MLVQTYIPDLFIEVMIDQCKQFKKVVSTETPKYTINI